MTWSLCRDFYSAPRRQEFRNHLQVSKPVCCPLLHDHCCYFHAAHNHFFFFSILNAMHLLKTSPQLSSLVLSSLFTGNYCLSGRLCKPLMPEYECASKYITLVQPQSQTVNAEARLVGKSTVFCRKFSHSNPSIRL